MSRHHSSAHTLGGLTIHAAPHFDPQVRAAGFPIDHEYVEKCWGPTLGPTSVMLLRRASDLWSEGLSPTVDVEDLSRMAGLGKTVGQNGPLWRSIARLERFRFAQAHGPGELAVYTEAPPLDAATLGRVPEWTRRQHYKLLDAHLAKLAGGQAASQHDPLTAAVTAATKGVNRPAVAPSSQLPPTSSTSDITRTHTQR